nr:MAG TPA: hypothetical protein [Bacteriophage sp.]
MNLDNCYFLTNVLYYIYLVVYLLLNKPSI